MAFAARFLLRRFSASAVLNPSNPDAVLSSLQKTRSALTLLKSEKDPDKILDICRAAALTPDYHLDRLALSAAVSNLTASSSFSTVRSLVDGLSTSTCTDTALKEQRLNARSIMLFGQAGLLDDAIRLFGRRPGVETLNALLVACVFAKRHDEAGRVFKEFPRSYGVQPDRDTYNAVIRAFCDSGSARSVYSLLEEMGQKGIKPNVTTYNTLIAGFYREGKDEEVEKVLQLMKKEGCSPTTSTLNTMIKTLCRLNKSSEAHALFEKRQEMKVKASHITYNHLVIGFSKEGKLDDAKRLFDEMRKRGFVPDSRCYFTLVHSLCQGGDFEEALKVYKDCMERNWVPCFSTMESLVKGLIGLSKVDEAREIVDTMKKKFEDKSEQWKEVEASMQ